MNRLLILLILCFSLSTCCTKKDCSGIQDINQITLLDFDLSELDSITIEIYPADSNFMSRIDSVLTQALDLDGNYTLYLPEVLNTAHNYKITVLSTNKAFKISNFNTEKEGCNSCFPYRPESDLVTVLSSYQVNGETQTGRKLSLKND